MSNNSAYKVEIKLDSLKSPIKSFKISSHEIEKSMNSSINLNNSSIVNKKMKG